MVGADSGTPDVERALARGVGFRKAVSFIANIFHQVCDSPQSIRWMPSRAELMSGMVWEGEMSSGACFTDGEVILQMLEAGVGQAGGKC